MTSSIQKSHENKNRLGEVARSTPSFETLRTTLSLLPDAVFCINRPAMTLAYLNRAACAWLGYTLEELAGISVLDVCPQEDPAALATRLDAAVVEESPAAAIRVRQRRKDGVAVLADWHAARIQDAGAEYWIVVAREASAGGTGESAAHTASEPRDFGIPGHDPLTSLPDRRLFERRLDRALERTRGHDDYKFAVCFIDLDNFKAVNDSLGHLIGDRVLCEIARRLSGCVRPGDMVARFGGDEFTVLVDNLHDEAEAVIVAGRIVEHMERPVAVDGRDVKVRASIGVAASSRNYRQFEELLRDADSAMYRVKAMGGGQCLLFAETSESGLVKPR